MNLENIEAIVEPKNADFLWHSNKTLRRELAKTKKELAKAKKKIKDLH